MNNNFINKIELLAPAGNLEKAKIALMYGADAVYVGGKSFSLRARASNFEIADLEELCNFAKGLNKKVYVTMNIIPHDEDMIGLDEYLKALEKAGVNAIITSSLAIIIRAKELVPKIERHVSTQTSIANSTTIRFYEKLGCSRVVLAREVNLEEMSKIKKNSNLELEVFIHGGMCASYSGRCVLSNHMTNRDANRGGCAHSCRWNYKLYQGKKMLPPKKMYFNMGSKDLMAIKEIPQMIDMGITSLKIEGRMKSTYYLATVVRCYRMLIDKYYQTKMLNEDDYSMFFEEVAKAENRLTSTGFLRGKVTTSEQLYDTREEHPTKEYIGYVLDYNEETNIALIEQRNYFEVGDIVELFGPTLNNAKAKITKMWDAQTNEELSVARHPLQKLYIELPIRVQTHDMMRKVK